MLRIFLYFCWLDMALMCFKTAQIAESPPSTVFACDGRSDYTQFEDHCYKCYVNSACNAQTYTAAVTQCSADDANLASIHSPAQNQFLYDLVTPLVSQCSQCVGSCDSTWIGLKPDMNTGFPAGYYADGSTYDYANWNSGDPVTGDPTLRTFVSRTPGMEGLWQTASVASTAANFFCCELVAADRSCTTVGVPNLFVPGSALNNPTAQPGQTVTFTCTQSFPFPSATDLFLEGENTANQGGELVGCSALGCVTQHQIICDGASGRFTFIAQAGPDIGLAVLLNSFQC